MSWSPLTCNLIYHLIPFSFYFSHVASCYFSDKLGILLPRAFVLVVHSTWNAPLSFLHSPVFIQVLFKYNFIKSFPACCCCCLVSQSYPTLCDLMEYSLPGSSVHRISQERILDWVSMWLSLYLPSLE